MRKLRPGGECLVQDWAGRWWEDQDQTNNNKDHVIMDQAVFYVRYIMPLNLHDNLVRQVVSDSPISWMGKLRYRPVQ